MVVFIPKINIFCDNNLNFLNIKCWVIERPLGDFKSLKSLNVALKSKQNDISNLSKKKS